MRPRRSVTAASSSQDNGGDGASHPCAGSGPRGLPWVWGCAAGSWDGFIFLSPCLFLLRCEESFPWLLFHLHFFAFYAMLGATAAGNDADPSQGPRTPRCSKSSCCCPWDAAPSSHTPYFHLSIFPSPRQHWGTEGFAARGVEAELGDVRARCCFPPPLSVCFAFALVLLSLVVFLGCRQCWTCPAILVSHLLARAEHFFPYPN